MQLAIHIVSSGGMPVLIEAIARGDGFCGFHGPHLIKPTDYRVPDVDGYSHRKCMRYGISLRAALHCLKDYGENAQSVLMHGLDDGMATLRGWFEMCGARDAEGWLRAGPERICTASISRPFCRSLMESDRSPTIAEASTALGVFDVTGAAAILAIYDRLRERGAYGSAA